MNSQSAGLARKLILDELFDLSLYRRLRPTAGAELSKVLDDLIMVEERHLAFWQDFFKMPLSKLDRLRQLKLHSIALICRLVGAPAIDLALEAIEVYGVRKYLSLWDMYKDKPMGAAVRGILQDEFQHEDLMVTRLQGRIINPDRVRNVFLGLNDGMVEILGAVSGFFASFGNSKLVLVAGLTTAVAGSLSMAAGAFVAIGSEDEVRRTQSAKARFLGEDNTRDPNRESAVSSALIVGGSYFSGAAFPLIPVVFGSATALFSIITGGTMILLVSAIVAFLSGMDMRKRTLTNLVLIFVAVGVTYLIGLLVRNLLGIQI